MGSLKSCLGFFEVLLGDVQYEAYNITGCAKQFCRSLATSAMCQVGVLCAASPEGSRDLSVLKPRLDLPLGTVGLEMCLLRPALLFKRLVTIGITVCTFHLYFIMLY